MRKAEEILEGIRRGLSHQEKFGSLDVFAAIEQAQREGWNEAIEHAASLSEMHDHRGDIATAIRKHHQTLPHREG